MPSYGHALRGEGRQTPSTRGSLSIQYIALPVFCRIKKELSDQTAVTGNPKALAKLNERVKGFKSSAQTYTVMTGPSNSGGEEKQYPKDTPENRAKKMKEFKVLVIDDTLDLLGSGQFDPKNLEGTLNSYGLEGWSIKQIETRHVPGIASLTYERIIILERDLPLEL